MIPTLITNHKHCFIQQMKLEKETRLKLAIGLSSVFVIVEVIGGYIANSIAIYSDAAHLLTDIAGFGIALVAVIASKAPGTKHLTFGLARAEVFGALGSIVSLWVITAFLLYAASERAIAWFQGQAEPVNGKFMFLVACFGVLVNICLGLVFSEDHGGDFHPSHSHCNHDHSHDGGHDHVELKSTAYSKVASSDIEEGGHDHSTCGGHGHESHGHEHDHGHDHGHSSKGSHAPHKSHSGNSNKNNSISDKTALLDPLIDGHDHDHSQCSSYQQACSGGDDHDHGHAHASTTEHDHANCSGHGHAEDYEEAHEGHGHNVKLPTDVNIEAAYLHVLTDLIQSIGVAIAGLAIWFFPDWQIIDPLCTFVFSFVALNSTVPLLKRVFNILLEGTPSHVDWEIVMAEFRALKGVEEVHDLHIWSISSKSTSLTVHIKAFHPQTVLRAAHKVCAKLGIDHATIQVQDAADSAFCFSKSCESHNPAHLYAKSSCVLSNILEIQNGVDGKV